MLKKAKVIVILAAVAGACLLFAGSTLHQGTEQAVSSEQEPQVVEMPRCTMAVVYTKGDPKAVGQKAMSALYGSVFQLGNELKKKGIPFTAGAPRARWPNAFTTPRELWVGIWGIPIPEGTTSVPQTSPEVEVKVEIWEYGTVAQILHIGPFETEPATIERLMKFIFSKGYEITGVHEEEYLSMPGAKEQKTIIRYPVKKK